MLYASLPTIAIIGRPNVGKSTLFNVLTRTRDAIVVDEPGVTRDRQYGQGKLGDKPYIVIDTGGILEKTRKEEEHQWHMEHQAWQAAKEADCLLFLVDARSGLLPGDELMCEQLRRLHKPVYLVVNKTDGLAPDLACADFHKLGLGNPYPIAASHGRGVLSLIEMVLETFPQAAEMAAVDAALFPGIRVAIVGRPNVGKSTLVNRFLNEERVVVADCPGTTRDSIFIPFEKGGKQYTLIDTAGVRRRGRIKETVEKFSVIKTLQTIEVAQVCIMLIDAIEGITDQDLHLMGFIIDAGKALVIGVNKWDRLTGKEKTKVRDNLERRLSFADFASIHYFSALRGTGVNALFGSVNKAYASATKSLSTPVLTRILEEAVRAHEPPLVGGRRVKLRYAHAGGHNPPVIVIHGNQTEVLPESYRRYLINTFRIALKLSGTPIRIELKTGDNPFEGKRNRLTPRQQYKRKRLMKFVKSKKK